MTFPPRAGAAIVQILAALSLGLLTSCGEADRGAAKTAETVVTAAPSAAPSAASAPARAAHPASVARADKGEDEDKDGPTAQKPAPAGLLTAAVWDDFTPEHWSDYQTFLGRYEAESWGENRLDLRHAVRLRLTWQGAPVRNCPVTISQGPQTYHLTTLADGSIRLFPGALHDLKPGPLTVTPQGGVSETIELVGADGGIVELSRAVDQAPGVAPGEPRLDLGFLIDATGSMHDEMKYLQNELRDIVGRIKPEGSKLAVRIAVVYYRDRGDQFVTKVAPFTENLNETIAFLTATKADGGGDFPEDMNAGFKAMMGLDWSGPGQAARLLVVLADAPPHPYPDADYTFRHALADAGRKGIALFPIAASGVDKATEHLFRAFAAATGGKYIFLTDDSGIGNPHLKPDITGYEVEPLNGLLVREIRAFTAGYYPQLEPPDRER